MKRPVVAIVRYEKPMESVRRAVDLSRSLHHLSPGSRVFIKPNIVFWTKEVRLPGSYMKKYQGKPGFEEAHFTVT